MFNFLKQLFKKKVRKERNVKEYIVGEVLISNGNKTEVRELKRREM